MRVELDPNLPSEIAHVLVPRGHDVHAVPDESMVGEPDESILAAAKRENRLLFTQDLDFSDNRRLAPGTHPGIVLLRLRDPNRRRILERIRQIIEQVDIETWAECLVVVSDRKLRVRRP